MLFGFWRNHAFVFLRNDTFFFGAIMLLGFCAMMLCGFSERPKRFQWFCFNGSTKYCWNSNVFWIYTMYVIQNNLTSRLFQFKLPFVHNYIKPKRMRHAVPRQPAQAARDRFVSHSLHETMVLCRIRFGLNCSVIYRGNTHPEFFFWSN